MKKKRIKALKKVNASLRSQLFSYKTLASENLDEIETLTEKYNEKIDDLNYCGLRIGVLESDLEQAISDLEYAEKALSHREIRENDIAEFTAKMMAYKNG